ncbi:hypothetical protein N665_2043s0001 [Sinapis alba]|nr:hypothetical protein N665_2043s0001 [Sinapis alba]
MKGVGGPLLSIGDLLADLVEETVDSAPPNPENSSNLETDTISGPLDLTRLFQVSLLVAMFFVWFCTRILITESSLSYAIYNVLFFHC